MKIAVVGATGRAGSQVVKQALERSYEVVALARNPASVTVEGQGLSVVGADVLDRDSLVDALSGCDAVISALGIGSSRAPTVVYSQGVANLLKAMKSSEVHNIAVISAAPVGPRAEQAFFERRMAMPILERIFGSTYDDMRKMEKVLLESEFDWISLRPPHLIGKPATGHYRMDIAPLPKGRNLTYGDLAAALLDSLSRTDLFHQALYVAN